MKTVLIKGAAGTGKTQTLVDFALEKLKKGTSIRNLLFCSYTREGTKAGSSRIVEYVGDEYSPRYYPFIRTLHSMCFYGLGVTKDCVVDKSSLEDFSKIYSYDVMDYSRNSSFSSMTGDAKLIGLYDLQRHNSSLFDQQFREARVTKHKYAQFIKDYEEWRKGFGFYDYTDLLVKFAEEEEPLPVEYAFIDEAQDLSPLMLRVIQVATSSCKEVYFAFDENQTIYGWAGADSSWIIDKSKEPETKLITKDVTYRLAPNVLRVSEDILTVIKNKIPYDIRPFDPDKEGEVYGLMNLFELNPNHHFMKGARLTGSLLKGNWLILVRDSYSGQKIAEQLVKQSVTFTTDILLPKEVSPMPLQFPEWLEAYKAVQRGESAEEDIAIHLVEEKYIKFDHDYSKDWTKSLLNLSPSQIAYYEDVMEHYNYEAKSFPYSIHLSTIHKQKGNEADNVLLYLRMPKKVYNNLRLGGEDEARLLYVGMTRSRGHTYFLEHAPGHSYRQSIYRLKQTAERRLK